VALFVITIVSSSFEVIDEGERGIITRFGEVSRIASPGVTFVMPFIYEIRTISIRTIREDATTTASSRDLQDVTTTVAVQFNVDRSEEKIKYIYSALGLNFKQTIIEPAIQEATKSASALYSAEELITKRHEVKDKILETLKLRLFNEGINVTNVDIVEFKFSSSFNRAIEAKVKAEQDALREKNNLERIKFESDQKIVAAKAEAEKIKIEASALRENGEDIIEKIKAEAYLEAVNVFYSLLKRYILFVILNYFDNFLQLNLLFLYIFHLLNR
jgi:regulator of protease activity HflC (stomatin/prohibitin superfamily)